MANGSAIKIERIMMGALETRTLVRQGRYFAIRKAGLPSQPNLDLDIVKYMEFIFTARGHSDFQISCDIDINLSIDFKKIAKGAAEGYEALTITNLHSSPTYMDVIFSEYHITNTALEIGSAQQAIPVFDKTKDNVLSGYAENWQSCILPITLLQNPTGTGWLSGAFPALVGLAVATVWEFLPVAWQGTDIAMLPDKFSGVVTLISGARGAGTTRVPLWRSELSMSVATFGAIDSFDTPGQGVLVRIPAGGNPAHYPALNTVYRYANSDTNKILNLNVIHRRRVDLE